MTVVAIRAAADVRCMFAGRGDAVMAGTAGADDLCVIDGNRRFKQRRAVAVLTDVAGLNMRRALARGCSTVVTADAVVGNAGVIK